MKKYFSQFNADLPAGLIVFLVAVPLCLGIAAVSGVSAFSGLIAGIVGGIVVGFVKRITIRREWPRSWSSGNYRYGSSRI